VAVFSVARLPRPPRLRYATGGWAFVFPLGMYATAGLTLGAVARMPLIHHVGAVAVWPAAAAWAVTACAMGAAAHARRERAAGGRESVPGRPAGALGHHRGGQTEPAATAPAPAPRGGETAQVMR